LQQQIQAHQQLQQQQKNINHQQMLLQSDQTVVIHSDLQEKISELEEERGRLLSSLDGYQVPIFAVC